MIKQLWVNTGGIGLDKNIRNIRFTDSEETERELLLGSGLNVYPDPLNPRRVRFHKSNRKAVVSFFKSHGIKAS